MRWLTRGEGRYAFLLIVLLVLAAVATVTTVSHIESEILSLEYEQAVARLQDYLSFEQRKLADLVKLAAGARTYTGDPDQYLDDVSAIEALAALDLTSIGLLSPEGELLSMKFTSEEARQAMIEDGSLLAWANAVPEDADAYSVQVGFVGTKTGPALMALARITAEETPAYLFLVRPLNRAYLRKIQETYPAFGGLADPEHVSSEGKVVPIFDLGGKRVGAFVLYLDLQWVERVGRSITIIIHVLTMGFLCLAGAMGLWAVRSSATVESMRRVGRFVDAMDYLQDGLIVLDKKGRVTGSNPAARSMAGEDPTNTTRLQELFPMLTEKDVSVLHDASRPREVEKTVRGIHGPGIWRFRSQPSSDMNLVLISDVTGERFQEMRKRQVATLQLIGRIARGVAHDFNNILCAVSGHASLLSLSSAANESEKESLDAIVNESQRGAALAAHLLQLSRTERGEHPTAQLVDHVKKAAELLRVGLSSQWDVTIDADKEFPTIPLSAVQVEQAVLNLGLAVADELGGAGRVQLSVRHPGREPLLDVEEMFAAVIVITASDVKGVDNHESASSRTHMDEEMGVIQSVVRTMLDEVGGRLDILLAGGRRTYRLCLPEYSVEDVSTGLVRVPEALATYVSKWHVLLGTARDDWAQRVTDELTPLGTKVKWTRDIVETLACVEDQRGFQAMVIDKQILGAEADGLLRAIIKLQPRAGLVVLCESAEEENSSLRGDVIFQPVSSDPSAVIEAMLKARELTGKRRKDT